LFVFSILVLNLRGYIDFYSSKQFTLEDKYEETFGIAERHEGRGNIIWPTTLNMIKNNFISGIGLGTYKGQYENYIPSSREFVNTSEIHAHNFYLHAFAELGVIGFIIYLLIFYIILKTALLVLINKSIIINWNYYIMFSIFIGISALLIHSLLDNLIFSREIAALFWMQVAFIFVIRK